MKPQCQTNCFVSFVVANVLILFSAMIGVGCGSSGVNETGTEQKAAVKAAVTTPAQPLKETNEYIPAMYLERNDFLDSNAVKYKDKLVLRLTLQKDSNRYRLTVSPTGKAGKVLDSASLRYPKAFVNELPASRAGTDHVFEEHHTKENDFQKLWEEIKKYRLVNYILFEPVLDSGQRFCYRITGVEKLPVDLSAAHGFATRAYYSHPSNHSWK